MENTISKIIRKLGKQYREENKCTLWQINNGQCQNFAEDILAALGGYGPETYELVTDNFFNIRGEDGAGAAFKDESGKYMFLNYGRLPDDINPDDFFGMGDHEWIYHAGKHYDAETPNGVENFLDLPIFQRAINRYRRERLKKKKPDFFNHKHIEEGLNLAKKPNSQGTPIYTTVDMAINNWPIKHVNNFVLHKLEDHDKVFKVGAHWYTQLSPEAFLQYLKDFNWHLAEGLNLAKKKPITYDKAQEQFHFFLGTLDTEYETGFDDFGDRILVTINNVGRGDFIDITLLWKLNDSFVHVTVEKYIIDPDTDSEDFQTIYEDDVQIIDPETMAQVLSDYIEDLIIKLYNDEPLNEGLNLVKKPRLSFDDINVGDIITGAKFENPYYNIPGNVQQKSPEYLTIHFKGFATSSRFLARKDFDSDEWKLLSEGLNLAKKHYTEEEKIVKDTIESLEIKTLPAMATVKFYVKDDRVMMELLERDNYLYVNKILMTDLREKLNLPRWDDIDDMLRIYFKRKNIAISFVNYITPNLKFSELPPQPDDDLFEGLNLVKKKYIEQRRSGRETGQGDQIWFWDAPWNKGGHVVRKEFYDDNGALYLWRNYLYNHITGIEMATYDSNGVVSGDWKFYDKHRGKMGIVEGLNLQKKNQIHYLDIYDALTQQLRPLIAKEYSFFDVEIAYEKVPETLTVNVRDVAFPNPDQQREEILDFYVEWKAENPYELNLNVWIWDAGERENYSISSEEVPFNTPEEIPNVVLNYIRNYNVSNNTVNEGLNLRKKQPVTADELKPIIDKMLDIAIERAIVRIGMTRNRNICI